MRHRDKIIIDKAVSEIDIGLDILGTSTLKEFEEDEKLKRAWKAIAGMRDIAAHKYQTLRMEDVYNAVSNDFMILKKN